MWPYIDRLFFSCQAIFGQQHVNEFLLIHSLLYYSVGESEFDGEVVGEVVRRMGLFQDWYCLLMSSVALWDAITKFWEALEDEID